MTAQSLIERMVRGDKMLTLFEQGLSCEAIRERFGLKHRHQVWNYLKEARDRREKAKAE